MAKSGVLDVIFKGFDHLKTINMSSKLNRKFLIQGGANSGKTNLMQNIYNLSL